MGVVLLKSEEDGKLTRRARGWWRPGYPDDEPILAGIAPMGADFSLNAIQPTVIAVSGRIWAADVPDTTVQSENCIVSRAKTSIEYSLPNNSSSPIHATNHS